MDIPRNQYTKWFDYDKIDKPLKIRKRKTGDFLAINKTLSKKSIQDYMVEAEKRMVAELVRKKRLGQNGKTCNEM